MDVIVVVVVVHIYIYGARFLPIGMIVMIVVAFQALVETLRLADADMLIPVSFTCRTIAGQSSESAV